MADRGHEFSLCQLMVSKRQGALFELVGQFPTQKENRNGSADEPLEIEPIRKLSMSRIEHHLQESNLALDCLVDEFPGVPKHSEVTAVNLVRPLQHGNTVEYGLL